MCRLARRSKRTTAGFFHITLHAIRRMVTQRNGDIINITDQARRPRQQQETLRAGVRRRDPLYKKGPRSSEFEFSFRWEQGGFEPATPLACRARADVAIVFYARRCGRRCRVGPGGRRRESRKPTHLNCPSADVGLSGEGLSSHAPKPDAVRFLAEAVVRPAAELVLVAVDHDLAFAPRALIQLLPQLGGLLA